MSPRPRKASDDQVLAATMTVMARSGPAQLTLADIAAEAGLTAGALVQRFGSKRALLLALSERFADSTATLFAVVRAAGPSPLAALYAYGACLARLGTTPEALANHLAWLQQDLTDPAFRRLALRQARAARRELARLVREAVDAGELIATTDPPALARAIEVTVGGSLMAWALHQDGTAAAWVRHDLAMLLTPWTAARPRRRPTGRGRPRRARR